MKFFENIHLILVLSLAIGTPVAATTHPPDVPFSFIDGLIQAAIAAGVILTLIVINMGIMRAIYARSKPKPAATPPSQNQSLE